MSTNLDRSTQKLEQIVWNYIRNNYENKFNQKNVPMDLKFTILSFAKQIIGSKFLTNKEDMKFMQFLLTKMVNIIKFRVLYTASKDGFKAHAFHNKCDGENRPTLTIIKSNFGNIFGGYTSVPWGTDSSQNDEYLRSRFYYFDNTTQTVRNTYNPDWKKVTRQTDQNAFLFLIRSINDMEQKDCPLIFDIKEDRKAMAVDHRPTYGPFFGPDLWIVNECNIIDKNLCCQSSYNYNSFKGVLCGEIKKEYKKCNVFKVVDYQVIEIVCKGVSL